MIYVVYSDLVKELPNIVLSEITWRQNIALSIWPGKQPARCFSVQYWHVQDSETLLWWNYLQRRYLSFSLVSWVLFSSDSSRRAGQPDVTCRNTDKVTWSCVNNRAWTLALPGHWSLRHNNSASHQLLCVRQFMAKQIYCRSWPPPHSPHLSPSKIWLYFGGAKSAWYHRHLTVCGSTVCFKSTATPWDCSDGDLWYCVVWMRR